LAISLFCAVWFAYHQRKFGFCWRRSKLFT
jgi:hypothetical protein